MILTLTAIAIATIAAPAPSQPVYFNHAYVDVAPATIEAIKQSSFLHDEFAATRVTTTVADGGQASWTGLYFYGERTYLEFFPAGGADDPLGKIGIGLSIDDRVKLPDLVKRMSTATNAPVSVYKRTRESAGIEVDWFDVIAPDYSGRESHLHDAWIMAVYPGYLRQRYPDLRPEEEGTSRQKMLARQYRPSRLLRDVAAISLTLPIAERERLVKQLRGSGYAVASIGDDEVATGPEFRFVISPVTPRHQRSITFHLLLNRKVKPQTLTLGGSTLIMSEDATATWHFPMKGGVAK